MHTGITLTASTYPSFGVSVPMSTVSILCVCVGIFLCVRTAEEVEHAYSSLSTRITCITAYTALHRIRQKRLSLVPLNGLRGPFVALGCLDDTPCTLRWKRSTCSASELITFSMTKSIIRVTRNFCRTPWSIEFIFLLVHHKLYHYDKIIWPI